MSDGKARYRDDGGDLGCSSQQMAAKLQGSGLLDASIEDGAQVLQVRSVTS